MRKTLDLSLADWYTSKPVTVLRRLDACTRDLSNRAVKHKYRELAQRKPHCRWSHNSKTWIGPFVRLRRS